MIELQCLVSAAVVAAKVSKDVGIPYLNSLVYGVSEEGFRIRVGDDRPLSLHFDSKGSLVTRTRGSGGSSPRGISTHVLVSLEGSLRYVSKLAGVLYENVWLHKVSEDGFEIHIGGVQSGQETLSLDFNREGRLRHGTLARWESLPGGGLVSEHCVNLRGLVGLEFLFEKDDRDSIVVVHSFKLDERKMLERGHTYWFQTESDANDYLERAGRPVEGKDHTYYDNPCEHRWDYVVVERVQEGPWSMNDTLSWWRARYENGRLQGLERCDPPFNTENSFNFSDIG